MKKTFGFKPSRDSLSEFSLLTPEQKLNWLEQANAFVNKYVDARKRERWLKLQNQKPTATRRI